MTFKRPGEAKTQGGGGFPWVCVCVCTVDAPQLTFLWPVTEGNSQTNYAPGNVKKTQRKGTPGTYENQSAHRALPPSPPTSTILLVSMVFAARYACFCGLGKEAKKGAIFKSFRWERKSLLRSNLK